MFPSSNRSATRRELNVLRALTLCLVLAVAWSYAAPAAAQSEQASPCFQKVWKDLKPNDPIWILQSNGSQLQGFLARVDLEQDKLAISATGGIDPGNVVLETRDIYKIEYQKAGKIQFTWSLGGLALGAIAGGVAGGATWTEDDNGFCEECSRSESAAIGAAVGAGAGLLLGTLISPLFKSKRTVTCTDPTTIR